MNSKTKTTNMFAATSEDLPLFSGFALTAAAEMPDTIHVSIPDSVGNIHHFIAYTPEQAPLFDLNDPETWAHHYDNYTVEALAVLTTSGLDGALRLDTYLETYPACNMINYRIECKYREAMRLYATALGITVQENPNVTYDGCYRLSDAMKNKR